MKRPAITAVAISALVLCVLLAPGFAAPVVARGLLAPPEPQEEPDILEQIFAFESYTPVLEVDDPADLSLGDYEEIHVPSEEFYTGAVTENLLTEILATDMWLSPVYHLGEPLGAVQVMTDGMGYWMAAEIRPSDIITDLKSLQPGDKVMEHWPEWLFILREDAVIPLDDATRRDITTTFTITEYQQFVLDRYAEFRATPGLEGGAGPHSMVTPESGLEAASGEPYDAKGLLVVFFLGGAAVVLTASKVYRR